MTCPNCGKSNKENEPFCSYCGAALVRAKTQKNVQKAVDAYVRKPKKSEEKNLLPAIIIICLCVLLVVVLILVIPKLVGMMSASQQTPSSTPTAATSPGDAEDAFSPSNPYYECYRAHDAYVLPGSDAKYLTRDDLKDLSKEELTVAWQEIYARHGQTFREGDLNDYFKNRTWYKPSETPSDLNTYEKANVILLEIFIAQKEGSLDRWGNTYLDRLEDVKDYVCKDSDTQYLTSEELKDLEEEALIIAYEEIMARKGKVFSDVELQEYFCSKEWYKPAAAVSDASLNEYETDNQTLIKLYQRRAEGVFPSIDSPYVEFYEPDHFVFPDSDTTLLSDSSFTDNSLNEKKCILGRNEIYARHGYVFGDDTLTEYFLTQEWYLPNAPIGDMSKLQLSDIEKKNIAHLEALETAFSKVPTTSSLDKSATYTVNHDKLTLILPAYWKDHTTKSTDGTKLYFRESITSGIYGDDLGLVCQFNVVAAADYTGPEDIFRKLGVLTDAEGNEWYVTCYTPSDVQFCFLTLNLGSQLNSDVSRVQVLAAEGYTYTPI